MAMHSRHLVESVCSTYLSALRASLAAIKEEPLYEALDLLARARAEGRLVIVFGNGGSAATAAHMACDLGKNASPVGTRRLRVIALAEATSTLTAYANDIGYEKTFAEPLLALGSAGDLAIAISCSGESPNILAAVRAARANGMLTLALTGPGASTLAGLADVCIHSHGQSFEEIEDVHLVVNHLLTVALRGSVTPSVSQ
jgi:D-sedoheptulose 7-phosphate isomerase